MTVHAMPLMIGVLAVLAVAYRYYSAFLAARVAVLDDTRITPAHTKDDGQNFHPTNRWVLFGHHFAATARTVRAPARRTGELPATPPAVGLSLLRCTSSPAPSASSRWRRGQLPS